MESQIEQKRTMASVGMATAGLLLVLLLAWTTTCLGGGEVSESAETGEVAAMDRNLKAVLVIPNQDCQAASFVLATVARHIRDAERSALYSPAAEDEYDDGYRR
jgi:hypothetical protein